MTDVRANTPSAAAAAPSHPEHPRWLKERTLAIEVAHATASGGTLRDAENANRRSLERLEANKRARPVLSPNSIARAESLHRRREDRRGKLGVTKKAIAPVAKVVRFKCNRCGLCLVCRRELRAIQIMAKAREGDLEMEWLTHNLVALHFAHQKRIDCKIAPTRSSVGREVPFGRMMLGGQRNTALLAAVSEICDWSVRALGAWRP